VVEQYWVDFGIYTKHPESSIGEWGAFYRIFFRHEYCFVIIEGKVSGTIWVVIRETMWHEGDAKIFQVLKITFWVANASYCMVIGFAKVFGWGSYCGGE